MCALLYIVTFNIKYGKCLVEIEKEKCMLTQSLKSGLWPNFSFNTI